MPTIRRSKLKSDLLPTRRATNSRENATFLRKQSTLRTLLILVIVALLFSIIGTKRNDHHHETTLQQQQPVSGVVAPRTSYSNSRTAYSKFQYNADPGHLNHDENATTGRQQQSQSENATSGHERRQSQSCHFRKYAPQRHYHLNSSHSFLQDATYVFGTKPFILRGDGPDPVKKICIDSSSWETITPSDRHKFSDGQNLSIMSFREYPSPYYKTQNTPRLRRETITPLVDLFGASSLDDMFLSVIYVGDSQCRWKETEEERTTFRVSELTAPPAVKTLVLILDENLNTVAQKDLLVDFDGTSKWGNKAGPRKPERSARQLDDPRFFFHEGEIWVLYRNGKAFGYEDQVHNKVHFEKKGDGDWEVYIKSNETVRVRPGRNMAMISDSGSLRTVFYIDPLIVVHLDEEVNKGKGPARGTPTSHVHGTNGMMIPLATTDEFLGIGHFHRPSGRDTSDFARHGHHYTHVFYTIEKKNSSEYRLKRISKEFVFPSMSLDGDADIIQFASGLELLGDDLTGRLLLSYGVNDCEGMAMWLNMSVVQGMLQDVEEGKEVVNYMVPEGEISLLRD